MNSKLPITVIILTFNEENNIVDCLNTLAGIFDDIIIVDSGSTDKTLELANKYEVNVYHNAFINYGQQRNWALLNVATKYDWILNIDADHRLTPEFIAEITMYFKKGIQDNIVGFMASRKTIFLNRWIKHGGHYPVYHGVLFRKGFGSCEEKEYDQHFVIDGKTIVLKGNIIDIIADNLDTFTTRHNKWATLEARDILALKTKEIKTIRPDKKGNLMERRRYQRLRYYRYPIFLRVFIYFFYRYIIKLGFLDGKQGLVFHFLQGFWFRFLVDAKIYEKKFES